MGYIPLMSWISEDNVLNKETCDSTIIVESNMAIVLSVDA
jgi:hypothetical protein